MSKSGQYIGGHSTMCYPCVWVLPVTIGNRWQQNEYVVSALISQLPEVPQASKPSSRTACKCHLQGIDLNFWVLRISIVNLLRARNFCTRRMRILGFYVIDVGLKTNGHILLTSVDSISAFHLSWLWKDWHLEQLLVGYLMQETLAWVQNSGHSSNSGTKLNNRKVQYLQDMWIS